MQHGMDFLYWGVFFIFYGFAFLGYSRWVAQRRVAALSGPSRFGTRQSILAMLGLLSLAAAPPLVELIVRIWYGKALTDSAFLAFASAWLTSAVPGVIVSRRILRAGGLNPDDGTRH
jgi:hypothetical protein